MLWNTRFAVPLAIAVSALACSESTEMQLTEPQAQIQGGPACKLSSLKSAARTFFGARTAGYAAAEKFTTKNANTAAVLPIFFELADHIAEKASAELTDAEINAGAEVHRQAVACAPVEDPDYADDMANVKLALGDSGAYQVRGRDGDDNNVVLSRNGGDNGSSGIKAPVGGFSAWTGGPVIFYGFTQDATLGGEAPADADLPATFQWFTVRPAGAQYHATLRGVVAICVNTTQAITESQLRIQHEDGDDASVLPVAAFDVCAAGVAQRLSPIGKALAWLEQRLAPAPLQAATVLLTTTSPSGSVKKFSPVEAVNPGGAVLAFEPSVIPDTPIQSGLGVKVRATGSGNVPWEGLLIKLVPFDNNGSFTLVPDTATTNAQGEADFTEAILDKPGAYRLLAITQPGPDGDATGFTQDSVVSGNRFNRTPN